MDWETYYEKFYDWATSTQISRMSSLTSYGASSEVAEVAQEYMDEKAASRLIRKAVAAGVQFTPEEIYDLSDCCDSAAMTVLLESAKCRFTREQLEELDGIVDADVLNKVAARNHVVLFEDEEAEDDEIEIEEEPPAKVGFFTALALGLGFAGRNKSRKGKCSGDCANCPAHYGYRYGRWYYGHHHTHGCEFGGNDGSGEP